MDTLPQAAAYQLAFNKPKPNKHKIINPPFSMLSDTQVQPVSLVTSHICGLSAALFKTILKTKKQTPRPPQIAEWQLRYSAWSAHVHV